QKLYHKLLEHSIDFPFPEQDKEHCAQCHQNRIVQIRHNFKRSQLRKTCCRQKLSTVWEAPLSNGSKDIEKRGGTSWLNAVLITDILCDRAGHDNSNRIVCRAQVHQKGKTCNTKLCAA